ncbi:heat-inducible transcription repressor HrcA [Desulfofundulus thermobenzoicus]|uniref:Heat-inducible transcription repressor HrcA n=1 Tax=Desulfofundulus thermobenzoicus TaxID=29376 RepID=A0A6N7INT6_9FIRM|nr:heat-inducible transcriptional repressor HrcA [Desulfofundulus thermobenzoicus]MQL51672.1 heat-inducible transcription repressor HrcA [Desulfofundulus thermobenzoicus]
MFLDARKQDILLAIITDYIATAEPVGSRTIARKYRLGISPATIRNEMSDLEEMGYIEQPHTSAGRIPSELGYRYYVDYLMKRQELTEEEEQLIRQSYRTNVRDVGEVIQRTGHLLSQLTRYAAMVVPPKMGAGLFKHIQLVQLGPEQAMLVVVMDSGALHHQIIEVPASITAADLETISRVLNDKLQGKSMTSIKLSLISEIYFELARHKHVLDLVMGLLHDYLTTEPEDKIYLGGVFNILNQPEFHNVEKVKTLLSILEQENLLSNLLSSEANREGVTVRIGREMHCRQMSNCSMVVATYHLRGRPVGSIGVLGPTRMDYAKVVSVVECMTRNLSRALEELLGSNRK